ncbi:MAG: AI-2E family transporter [Gammaproteobacteria bacterium]|nr:AI-2E family transporter [Gammaproteobacteria bacterium]MBU1646217.1 AI-2E family transporter [Gammaproteobacteria bacterium]MBU1972279.1 AI-2E family transporter [Gammaproteobacteria bacterium]
MPLTPDRLQAAFWIAFALACAWLLSILGPILTPFMLAGILAYIWSPVVGRLQRLGLPRIVGVLVVLLAMIGLLAALALILLPLLIGEANQLAGRLPDALTLANEKLLVWLQQNFDIQLKLDPASIRQIIGDNMDSVQVVLQKIYHSVKVGGSALIAFAAMLVLVPVAMFYLLLDWDKLLDRAGQLPPRRWHGKIVELAHAVDAVLSEYLRGQVLVMVILAIYYSLALWIAGLPSAVSVGVLTGMLIFIPYLGFATGMLLALLVAALQFQGVTPIVAVLIVFGIGQALESMVLTPYLVGDRIGLHPLAVIFALMAFGQLFGFFGILLALPASAALLVGLRELKRQYVGSDFYQGPPA